MCIFRRNKFYKINREDVVNVVCDLQKEESSIEEDIKSISLRINSIFEEAKNDKEDRVYLVKKMSNEIEERAIKNKRAMLLIYNIKLAKRLLNAIDDNILVNKLTKINIFEYMKDQKKLAYYLNNLLEVKISYENILTDADDAFVEVENMFKDNEKVYTIYSKTEDEILTMLERIDEENSDVKNKEGAI